MFWKAFTVNRVLAVALIFGVGYGTAALLYANSYTLTAKMPTTQVQGTTPTPETLLAAVNAERAKYGSAPLALDNKLNTTAQEKADDETNNHYFGHTNPVTGKFGPQLINDSGIQCTYVSENLTEPTPVSVEQSMYNWDHSKPHHDAMVDAKYTMTGFGISGRNIVEHFCQP